MTIILIRLYYLPFSRQTLGVGEGMGNTGKYHEDFMLLGGGGLYSLSSVKQTLMPIF